MSLDINLIVSFLGLALFWRQALAYFSSVALCLPSPVFRDYRDLLLLPDPPIRAQTLTASSQWSVILGPGYLNMDTHLWYYWTESNVFAWYTWCQLMLKPVRLFSWYEDLRERELSGSPRLTGIVLRCLTSYPASFIVPHTLKSAHLHFPGIFSGPQKRFRAQGRKTHLFPFDCHFPAFANYERVPRSAGLLILSGST